MTDGGGIPPSALDALAIFPLPNVVLFPHALLPLHIFEPRYREMIADVLDGTQLLAVARLQPGFEVDYDGRPAVHAIAGIGSCIAHERLPDGRYDILLRGLGRVVIEEELAPDRAYRVVRARPLIDSRSQRPATLADGHTALVAACERLAEVGIPESERSVAFLRLVRSMPTPGACADLVASALVEDADARQELLETLDPADRVEHLIAHVLALADKLRPGGRTVN